ncbi:MAG: DUF899 domain-containing protein [Verrucomicrobiaceae bacterium]|nr:MAG: DUF899 domain-containing protein [Verrucomicrobiaceae bacterium]
MKNPNKTRVGDAISGHPVLPHDQWIEARKKLLEKERELTHLMDEVNAARRALPWEKVEKDYRFQGPSGELKLADLFQGKRQLIVYHFMYAPGWEEGCVGCSFFADHIGGVLQHIGNADVRLLCVSRGTLPELEAYKKRMDWDFDWVSSHGSDFNTDYGVSFSPELVETGDVGYNYATSSGAYEELPGVSVFYQDEEGNVFHTYSSYARGLDILVGTLRFLDLTPKGRCDGEGPEDTWLKHHDKYESAGGGNCCGCK